MKNNSTPNPTVIDKPKILMIVGNKSFMMDKFKNSRAHWEYQDTHDKISDFLELLSDQSFLTKLYFYDGVVFALGQDDIEMGAEGDVLASLTKVIVDRIIQLQCTVYVVQLTEVDDGNKLTDIALYNMDIEEDKRMKVIDNKKGLVMIKNKWVRDGHILTTECHYWGY